MTERLDYGGWDYDDDDYDDGLAEDGYGNYGYGEDGHDEDGYGEALADESGDGGGDFKYDGAGTGAEQFAEQHDLAERQAHFAVDDAGGNDFEERFGWRSKARRRRQGQFVPPDMTWHLTPVFVGVKGLTGNDTG